MGIYNRLNILLSTYSSVTMTLPRKLFTTVSMGMCTCLTNHSTPRELLLLSMTVSMGMLIFAGLGYALEKDEPDTMFYTLPQTLYWAIITMTSTGRTQTVQCVVHFISINHFIK